MKVLFVYPEFKETFWSWKHILRRYVSKRAAFPPLGLLTIAAMLPDAWEKKLVDLNVCRISDKQLKWADYVFVSAMIAQKDSARQVISRCAKLGVEVCIGGPILENGCEEFSEVSHVFLGEAEETIPAFLADLEERRYRKVYDSSGNFPDVSKTPIPLWNLVSPKNYASCMVQWSRGCPYGKEGCSFCNIASLNGYVPRAKTVSQFLAEMDAIYEAGFRGPVFIADDNFVGNIPKTMLMLGELAKWQEARGHPFNFTVEVPIIIADKPPLMDAMVKAGVGKVFLGIETPNRASLAECDKMQNLNRDLEADVAKIQAHGLLPMSGFIVGFDADAFGNFDQAMIDFIQKTGICIAMVGVLQAPPNTRLYRRLANQGRISKDASGNNTDCYPNFIPVMPVERLAAGYRRIMSAIYSPRKYYERIMVFLRRYDASRKVKKAVSFADIRSFLRSVLFIGVFGGLKNSWYYWKTLLFAFRERRQAFPDAVALWIYGMHFQKIARAVLKEH